MNPFKRLQNFVKVVTITTRSVILLAILLGYYTLINPPTAATSLPSMAVELFLLLWAGNFVADEVI